MCSLSAGRCQFKRVTRNAFLSGAYRRFMFMATRPPGLAPPLLMEFSSTLKQAIPPVPCRFDIRLLPSPPRGTQRRGKCKLVCLLASHDG